MHFSKRTVFFYCFFFWKTAQSVMNNGIGIKNFISSYNQHYHDVTIHKVSFTQKGYIQFLRYITDVPPIKDYTFCIWIRSNNLTHSHPLLSYSKHEEDRLIRVWLSPYGTHINLEILEHPIFKVPVHVMENHWYHICQSWSSQQASWNLYFNGKLKSSGFAPQLRGFKIKGGGDIVVGQEYTDFDKGLDDGIEGDVFGFNFVLSPTSFAPKHDFPLRRYYWEERRPSFVYPARDIPGVLGYFPTDSYRNPKGISDIFGFFDPPVMRVHSGQRYHSGSRIVNDIEEIAPKPTGLKLVELSYNCALGKGAPVNGKDVLVSWTKTPVRVFGGAILKNIPPFCS